MAEMARFFLTTDSNDNQVLAFNVFNSTHLVQAGLIVLAIAAIAFLLTNLSSFSAAYKRFDTGAPSGFHHIPHEEFQTRHKMHKRSAHNGNVVLIFLKKTYIVS